MSFIDDLLSTIVSVEKSYGVLLLILNIFIPGLGTIINACMADKIVIKGVLIGIA